MAYGENYDPYAGTGGTNPNYTDPYALYGIYDMYGGQDAYNSYLSNDGNIPSYQYGEDFMAQLTEMGLDPSMFNSLFGQMRKQDPYNERVTGFGGSQGQITMDTLQQMYDTGLDPDNTGVVNLFQSMLGIDPNATGGPTTDYDSILGGKPKGGSGMSRKMMKRMADQIKEIYANPGMAKDVMADARTGISAANRGREKTLLDRYSNAQAGRGMFRSGLTNEGQLDIMDRSSDDLYGEMSKLEMKNAQMAEQALARAFQGTLGMGNIDAQNFQTRMSGELGWGNLKLQELKMNMENAIQQMLINLGISSKYTGTGG